MGTCAAFAGDDLLAEVVLERMLAVLAYRKFTTAQELVGLNRPGSAPGWKPTLAMDWLLRPEEVVAESFVALRFRSARHRSCAVE